MLYFKQNGSESEKTDNVNEATRAFINVQSLVNAKIIKDKNSIDDVDINHTKLVAMKTRLNFQGNIAVTKSGSGIVIHRNAPKEEVDFDIDGFLAPSV